MKTTLQRARKFIASFDDWPYNSDSEALAAFADQLLAEQAEARGVVETCGWCEHDFIKLPDHPKRDGLARCPYCLSIGWDKFQIENRQLKQALSLAGKRCSEVHHTPAMYHESDVPCPVEAMVYKMLGEENPNVSTTND